MYTKHGHLVPGSEDEGYSGPKVRCGGPGLCKVCSQYKYLGLVGTIILDEATQKEFGGPPKLTDEQLLYNVMARILSTDKEHNGYVFVRKSWRSGDDIKPNHITLDGSWHVSDEEYVVLNKLWRDAG